MTLIKDPILWCDFETTGLDPNHHSIIEMAFVLTDGFRPIDIFKESAHDSLDISADCKFEDAVFTTVIASDPVPEMQWSTHAYEMHKKSGLYDQLMREHNEQRLTRQAFVDTEHYIASSLQRVLMHDGKLQCPRLAGSSVHFDKGFMLKKMPSLHSMLFYRILDVSSVWGFFDMCKRSFPDDKSEAAHRAKDDIVRSFTIAKRLGGILLDDVLLGALP